MNYLTRICNKKIITTLGLIFLLFACSSIIPGPKKRIPTPTVTAVPDWFKVDDRFVTLTVAGEVPAHPFFDLVPYSSKKDNSINFFPVTASGSPAAYDFNLPTGKRYKRYDYCAQKDVWKNFFWWLKTPPFTIGIVPRLIDQRGLPQKIYVFGGDDYFASELEKKRIKSYRVRVVGGVIEQYCSDYPCTEKGTWLSRLVLLAVDSGDPKMGWVTNIKELKQAVNWNYVKSYMENEGGRNITASGDKPAYRIFGAIKPEIALSSALTKGKLFDYGTMVKMRSNCHKLYDYIWEQTSRIREKKIKGTFAQFFYKFYVEFGERYKTCAKFIPPSSINSNIARHWFFTYLTGFMKLDQLNYVFSCRGRVWFHNGITLSGKPKVNPVEEYKSCTTNDLNYSFDLVELALTGLRQSHQQYFRYIEYDESANGSHERIHYWVDRNGKRLSCGEPEKARLTPQDLSWRRF